MRLLHLSDWHLGTTLGRVSRVPDHEAVLDEMVAIAAGYRPHLVVHTGDLFDHSRPAVDDLRLGVETLRRLAAYAPVVVLAGNHDSPHLFEVFDRLLALGAGGRSTASPVRFVGRARPPAAGGVLSFPGERDEEVRLAPLPFVHPNALLEAFDVAPERWTANYTDQVRIYEERLGDGLAEGFDPNRHVLLFAAHLHVGGARFSGSERMVHCTDGYATTVEHLPAVSYAAFGHIHRPQALPGGRARGRYAGSPIAVDFGEAGEPKGVVTVEARPGRVAA
ncbi:MAG: metallophosphoesterase family protein, partial [Acidimicrobiales bacterium]